MQILHNVIEQSAALLFAALCDLLVAERRQISEGYRVPTDFDRLKEADYQLYYRPPPVFTKAFAVFPAESRLVTLLSDGYIPKSVA